MSPALHAVSGLLSSSPGLAPDDPSNAASRRFQELVLNPGLEDDGQAREPIATEVDAQAQALDAQVLSGLVGAIGLNPADPESDDE